MALRKPLFMTTAGYAEEMAAADSLQLGALTMSGDIAMGAHKVTGLLQASASGDALAWGQNASIANLTVTGALAAAMSAGSFKITNLAQASATADALGWGQNASVANFAVTGALTADMAAGTHKITGLAQASATGDALAWGQNASVANLTVTGTLGADMAAGTHKITGLAQASATGDALGWGQNASVNNLTVTGALAAAMSAGGFKITNIADPTAAQDVASKAYVDAVKTGLDFKDSVRVIATSNITLSGTQTIDGVAVVAGDRVLVAGQTAAKDNGIYVVAAGAWSRASDADNTPGQELGPGAFAFVEEGTVYKDCGFVMTSDSPFTLGTSACNWVQFSSAGVIVAGNGLSKTGNTLNVNKGNGIKFDGSNNVAVDLTSSGGLQFTGTQLGVQADFAKGIQLSASGVGINTSVANGLKFSANQLALAYDSNDPILLLGANGLYTDLSGAVDDTTIQWGGTPFSLAVKLSGDTLVTAGDSSGIMVAGVPALFKINGVNTNVTVGALQLNTLTGGDSTNSGDDLHRHEHVATKLTSSGIASAAPVYLNSTGNAVSAADASDDNKRNVIGLYRSDGLIISHGVLKNVLTNATPGTKYYLAAGGGLTTTLPAAGNNIIQVGYAKSAGDLFVQIQDFGKRAA